MLIYARKWVLTREPGVLSGRSSTGHGEILELVDRERLVHDSARIQVGAHESLLRYGKHVVFGTKHGVAFSARNVGEIAQQREHVDETLIDAVHGETANAHVVVERKIRQQPVAEHERIVRVVDNNRGGRRRSCTFLILHILAESLEFFLDGVHEIVAVVVAVEPSGLAELGVEQLGFGETTHRRTCLRVQERVENRVRVGHGLSHERIAIEHELGQDAHRGHEAPGDVFAQTNDTKPLAAFYLEYYAHATVEDRCGGEIDGRVLIAIRDRYDLGYDTELGVFRSRGGRCSFRIS